MDIILNEKSLVGQFDHDSFSEYLLCHIIPILKLSRQLNISLFKSSDTYKCQVTENTSLFDFIKIKGDPVIDRIKTYLVSLYKEDPFWNIEPLTDISKDYYCKNFENVPNCVTEAFERQGLVLSFENDDFKHKFFKIVIDKIAYDIRNSCYLCDFESHLEDLELKERTWTNNSFNILETGYFFEIRFSEGNHNQQHFHVRKRNGSSASYSIPGLKKLAGDIPNEDEKSILQWAKSNNDNIINLWNKFHPEKKITN